MFQDLNDLILLFYEKPQSEQNSEGLVKTGSGSVSGSGSGSGFRSLKKKVYIHINYGQKNKHKYTNKYIVFDNLYEKVLSIV